MQQYDEQGLKTSQKDSDFSIAATIEPKEAVA